MIDFLAYFVLAACVVGFCLGAAIGEVELLAVFNASSLRAVRAQLSDSRKVLAALGLTLVGEAVAVALALAVVL
jgi:hypothetical protein